MIADELDRLPRSPHHAGTLSTSTIRRLEELLPSHMTRTAETGCGKSTILFSNLSEAHTAFCLDDREYGEDSSVLFFEESGLSRVDRVEFVFGPTQKTLPVYDRFATYDAVLIDGPHGFPFPELEYYFLYPHIREGGHLILDDIHIPTIGRMADFLQEDDMFVLEERIGTTALFRRTSAKTFDPFGDGWWTQKYNQRRVPPDHEFYLGDGKKMESAYPSDPAAKAYNHSGAPKPGSMLDRILGRSK